MAGYRVHYRGHGWFDATAFDVESESGERLGHILVPDDRRILDIVDDPLTVWCSDNGYSVNDVFCDY